MTKRKKTKKSKGRKKASTGKSSSKKENKNPLFHETPFNGDKVFIECPGATIYEPGTNNIIAGVRFFDEDDPSKGYEIIGNPVYAPGHRKRRLVKREHAGSIRRCQACQDLTVRMIRREGPDFYIPNHKNPHRRSLKPIEKSW